MGKINLDPRAFYSILVAVVLVAALLVYRGANATQTVKLPDPNMFKSGSAKTVSTNTGPIPQKP